MQVNVRSIPLRLATVLLVTMSIVVLEASPAHAGSLLWRDATQFTSFGANEAITIDTGTVDYVGGCPSGGYDDFFYPFSDIYIVPSGSATVGAALEDVGGVPNTVGGVGGGLFISETIGYTGPGGAIPAGTYAVVYDHCQDGKLQANDDVFDPAFEVVIPADVPPLPSSFFSSKADAVVEAQQWSRTCGLFELVTFLADNMPGPGTQRKADELLEEALGQFTDALSGALGVDPIEGTKSVCANQVKHFTALAADPAEPDFAQATTLAPRPAPQALPTADPFVVAMDALTRASIDQAALLEAYVAAAESYQGADEVGDGDWALAHARDLQAYAELLRAELAATTAAAADAAAALVAAPEDLDALFADFASAAGRWVAGDFTDGELRAAANLGLDESDLAELSVGVLDVQVPFDRAALQSDLEGIAASNAALTASLDALVADLTDRIVFLDGQAAVSDQLPQADAGGPYSGAAGTSIDLDASASVAPSGLTSVAWDLDGDGVFDDASGSTATLVLDATTTGLVGVELTAADGRVDRDFASVAVTGANRPPVATGTSPDPALLTATVGEPVVATVLVDDPDGDPVTVSWAVDGVSTGTTGTSFTWTPGPGDVGFHGITATLDDGSPGGVRDVTFRATVRPVDADGDDWAANADCDDDDPDVNPGATEVPFNGKDDDCSAFTPDAGEAPIASFTSTPDGPVVGETVQFTDTSVDPDGTVVSWDWDFGDGSGSTAEDPGHAYAAPGTYTVTLEVSDDEGFLGNASAEVTVTDPGAPVPDFDVSSGPWFAGDPIVFTDLSADPDGTIVSWDWDFGDGGSSTNQDPTHTYATAGTYLVTLTVVDDVGKSATVAAELPVAEPTQPPAASFDSPSTGFVTEQVTFTNTSTDPDGEALDSFWDFGDGVTSTAASPTHTYSLPGTYEVRLVVVDPNGATDSATSEITVSIPPTAPVVDTGDDRTIDEGLELVLAAEGSGDTRVTYADPNPGETHTATIDWGDGSAIELVAAAGGTLANLRHLYVEDGTYVVEACVTDTTGRTGCDSMVLTVRNVAPDVSLTDLNRWTAESYPAVGGFPAGRWEVAEDGLTVFQSQNGQPTLFLSEFDVFNTEASVNISVSGGDDDMIGFVLGFRPGDTTAADADFLLVDWKGRTQSFNFSEGCGTGGSTAEAGLAVTRVTGIPTADELWGHDDFTTPECATQGTVEELARGATLGSTGWSLGQEHEFRISYTATRLQIWVDGVQEFDLTGDFPPGRLGFYNFSQAGVTYRAFDLEAAGGVEGSPVDLAGSFKDDGVLDTHTGVFAWGDGTPTSRAVVVEDEGAGTATSTHTYVEDGAYPASICVTDDEGDTGCDEIEVRVSNLPPVVEAGPDVTTAGPVALEPASFTDAGILDTHTATVDWGDGTAPVVAVVDQGAGSGFVDASHDYTSPGAYTVEVCVADDDGGEGCDTFTVTVSAPSTPQVVEVEAGHTFPEGTEHVHALSFLDEDGDEGHTVTVDWGDGSPGTTAEVVELGGAGNARASHTYGDDGSYTVTWTVCDAGDDCDEVQVVETVTNVAPVTTAAAPVETDQFATGELVLATYSDDGFLDTHTATVDWGDGSGPVAAGVTGVDGAGQVAASHTYEANGIYPVEICVTDDDGAVDCDATSITVAVPLGTIVIEKVTEPGGGSGFGFTSDVAGSTSFSLDDGGVRTMQDVPPGTYTVTEDDPGPLHVVADVTCDGDATGDAAAASAVIDLAAGATVTCTFTNLATAGVELTKLTSGRVDPRSNWSFAVYEGADGFGATALGTQSSGGVEDGVLDLDGVRLDPRMTYTVCELEVPAGWSSRWRLDTTGDGVVDTTVIAYNPNADDETPADLGNRCFDVGHATPYAVAAGGLVVLEIDNRQPGGDPRTPGFWKNWNTCTNGGQAANAERNGGAAAGWFILDDILTDPGVTWGDFTIATCEDGVAVLDQRDLDRGRKRASDGAYTLAMHLLAAQLNLAAGAETCTAAQDAVVAGEDLLEAIDFHGVGRFLRSKDVRYEEALALAQALDDYNNGRLC